MDARVRLRRDHPDLDVAALTDRYGTAASAAVLARLDAYYHDQRGEGRGVAAQFARQLADPRPKDTSVTEELDAYRNLARRWTRWDQVREVCGEVAAEMAEDEV